MAPCDGRNQLRKLPRPRPDADTSNRLAINAVHSDARSAPFALVGALDPGGDHFFHAIRADRRG